MLFTRARTVPDIATAFSAPTRALHTISSPSRATSTAPVSAWRRVPSGPFTAISASEIITSTPCGIATGFLATRDIASSLGNQADDFAANAVCARRTVSHQATRGGNNGHAKAVHHARQIFAALVDAQAGTAHALQALDDRTTGVVLERHIERSITGFVTNGKTVDVTFILQYFGDRN